MGGERGGSKTGGFFHLFDWNRKSRKKLFSNSPGKSTCPVRKSRCLVILPFIIGTGFFPHVYHAEATKQGKRSNDTLPATQLHLVSCLVALRQMELFSL